MDLSTNVLAILNPVIAVGIGTPAIFPFGIRVPLIVS
jgi:hypothetical protein